MNLKDLSTPGGLEESEGNRADDKSRGKQYG